MLDRLCRVIDWIAFVCVVPIIFAVISNLITLKYPYGSLAEAYVIPFTIIAYFVVQVFMYIVRGKVRFLPWR